MCRKLGANLDVYDINFNPSIQNPFDESRIYLMLDPSHMEKLMRNLLGNKGVLFDQNDREIKWDYFVELEKLSTNGSMLMHKLTRKHIEFKQNKMNVRIAVETFSESVGDSIKMLRENNHPFFVNSESTTDFVYMMDKLFNILNSRYICDSRHKNIFKNALSEINKSEICSFIEKSIEYFIGLKVKRTAGKRNGRRISEKIPILKTVNFTPVLGFVMCLTNLKRMYAEYIENGLMKEIRTYGFSQDHLEILHAKIRSRNGHNNNPTVMQFKGAYRRLLCNLDIKPSRWSNCAIFDTFDPETTDFSPQSNVYFISSRRPKLDVMNDEVFQRNLENQQDEISMELGQMYELEGFERNHHLFGGYVGASLAYAAYIIEKRIESRTFHCDCCKLVFSENEKLCERSIQMIESKRPCVSTFYICKIIDKVMSLWKPKCFENHRDRDFRVLYYMAFQEINFENVYPLSDFKNHEEHKFHLVKCIVQQFINIKTSQICKQISLDLHEKILRSKLTNWIKFCGQ